MMGGKRDGALAVRRDRARGLVRPGCPGSRGAPTLLFFTAALLAVGSLGAPTAYADTPNAVTLRVGSVYVLDDAFGAFGANSALIQGEVDYARALLPIWRMTLWAEGTASIGRRHTELFSNRFETSGLFATITGGGRLTLPVCPGFVAQVRAGLGALIGRMSLQARQPSSDRRQQAVSDVAGGVIGYAMAGVQFLLPRRWIHARDEGFTAGITVEGGMTFSSDLAFAPKPARTGDEIRMEVTAAGLGGVNLTAPGFRVGAMVVF